MRALKIKKGWNGARARMLLNWGCLLKVNYYHAEPRSRGESQEICHGRDGETRYGPIIKRRTPGVRRENLLGRGFKSGFDTRSAQLLLNCIVPAWFVRGRFACHIAAVD
jgi:hypothetical protein